MLILKLLGSLALLFVVVTGSLSCAPPSPASLEGSRKIAEEFVRNEATFQFDGMAETLNIVDHAAAAGGWIFTIEYDSRHGGFGNRAGQMLTQVITRHRAEVTVQNDKVTTAIMDGQWDMINQRMDLEITLAPIDRVQVVILKSNPPQIAVNITGGLPDGCTRFHNLEVTREGTTVNIKVTNQRPRGVACPAIYTTFEKHVNLGIDFAFGTTYTLKVNDYITTFEGTLMSR
ncbi:MAG TPA: hypothetical protein VLH15_04990 [Dehalococcoidales bacterium]|nr:hypothetical protein [Dehalococcoidales bacterium]